MKLAMVIDSRRCIGCKACMVSCKTAHQVPEGYWRNWVKEAVPAKPLPSGAQGGPTLSHFQPGACMHCEKPTCVEACPTNATSRNPATGEVLVDRTLCIGCGNCIKACPYDARYKHPTLHVADKCDYCAYRREQGLEPACVQTCPTKARIFGDLDDPKSAAAQLVAAMAPPIRVENAQSPTSPNMLYVKNTAPTDWTRPAEQSSSLAFLNHVAQPLVKIVVGVTGIGVLAAVARQLCFPDAPEQDQAPSPDNEQKEDNHD